MKIFLQDSLVMMGRSAMTTLAHKLEGQRSRQVS